MKTVETTKLEKSIAIEFANWLRDNFSPMSDQQNGSWLPKNEWRLDFTTKIYDVEYLYEFYFSDRSIIDLVREP